MKHLVRILLFVTFWLGLSAFAQTTDDGIISYRGEYTSTKLYARGDQTHTTDTSGNGYLCNSRIYPNQNNAPLTSPNFWDCFALSGAGGSTGAVAGVTSISQNGAAAQTGAVSINAQSVGADASGAAATAQANAQTYVTNHAELTANKGVANGYAPLDSTGKVPSANLPAAQSGGTDSLDSTGTINNLPVQGYQTYSRPAMASWLAALHDCNNKPVNLVALTDSYGMAALYNGAGPTDPNDRYLSQLRLQLQKVCPSHGTGWHPFAQQLFMGQTSGSSFVVVPDGRFFGTVNNGTAVSSSVIGPAQPYNGASAVGALTQIPSGAAFIFSSGTDNIPYNKIKTICASGPGYGTWTIYQGDETQSGSGATQVGTCGSSSDSSVTAHLSAISLSSTAAQTVTYVCTGGSPCLFYAANGVNGTTGVSVSPLSMASSVAEMYTTSTAFAFLDLINGDEGINALVTNWGTNEHGEGYTSTTFQNALTGIINHEKAQTVVPSILMLTSPVINPSNDSTSATYAPQMAAAQLTLAQTLKGVAVANIQDRWGLTYDARYFDGSSDGTHPGDTGTLSEAALLLEHLIDTTPYFPSAAGNTTGNVSGINPAPTVTALPSSQFAGWVLDSSQLTQYGGQKWGWYNIANANTTAMVMMNLTGGFGAAAMKATSTSQQQFTVGKNGQLCWASNVDLQGVTTIDTCLSRTAAGQVAIGNGTQGDSSGSLVNATGGAIAWGTPTIAASGSSGAASVGGDWANSDNAFSLLLNPSASIAPGTAIATVTFGKPFLDSGGNSIVPACVFSGLVNGGASPVYVSGVASATNASGQTVQKFTISTTPYAATIASGASGLIYQGNCSGYKQ